MTLSSVQFRELRMVEHLPLRSLHTTFKHAQEPFLLFGKSYCWTLLDENFSLTDTLRLVRTDSYHQSINTVLKQVQKDKETSTHVD